MRKILKFIFIAILVSFIVIISGCKDHNEDEPIIIPVGVNSVILYNNSERDINDFLKLKLSDFNLTFGWHYETDKRVEYSWVNLGKTNDLTNVQDIPENGWIEGNSIPLVVASSRHIKKTSETSSISPGDVSILQSTEILTDPPYWPDYYAQILFTAIKFIKFTEHYKDGHLNFEDRFDFETKMLNNQIKLKQLKREISASGGLVSFELKEPSSFKILRLPSWIKIEKLDQSSIIFNVIENYEESPRIGEIYIGDNIYTDYIKLKVIQEAEI